MPDPRRVLELTLFDFKHTLTSLKGLVFIITYFFFWYIVFNMISVNAVEWLRSPQGLMLVSWLLQDQDMVINMLVERSASLSLYLFFSISFMPFFMMLASNNQYSSDASSGAFRFVLTRTTRLELYLSRFLSSLVLVTCCSFISLCWAMTLTFINEAESTQTVLMYAGETYVIIFLYSLPFIAFMGMVSALARTGFGSLFLGLCLYTTLLIVVAWLGDDLAVLTYLVPSSIKTSLYQVSPENIIFALQVLSLYTLVFFSLGWALFKRRDI